MFQLLLQLPLLCEPPNNKVLTNFHIHNFIISFFLSFRSSIHSLAHHHFLMLILFLFLPPKVTRPIPHSSALLAFFYLDLVFVRLQFLGMITKLERETICLVMSVCLSAVYPSIRLAPTEQIFMKFGICCSRWCMAYVVKL